VKSPGGFKLGSILAEAAYDAIDSSAYLASDCATVRLEIDRAVWGTPLMNQKLNAYGVPIVERPKVKAIKKMDLSGDSGKQIVYSETKLVLRTHKKTFQKLADM
jgi:hypothetical protein